ncbi:DsbA family oxidoreductase [Mangrovimicrobium sediminis]|nr:DsbA family protein [Haliea sp. SAOS-164]
MNREIIVDYYSDVLCVWAWIAQPRLDELARQWQGRVTVNHHFVDVFGDAHRKIPERWGADDGYQRFNEHVRHCAEPFDASAVHERCWLDVQPRSSAQAHLLLRAVGLVAGAQALANLALVIRRAFFCEAQDVSDMELLLELAGEARIDVQALRDSLRDGSALAAYSSDLRRAADLGVRGSPTWILNEGRQTLYGNVGYRILHANIEELLSHPEDEASWC